MIRFQTLFFFDKSWSNGMFDTTKRWSTTFKFKTYCVLKKMLFFNESREGSPKMFFRFLAKTMDILRTKVVSFFWFCRLKAQKTVFFANFPPPPMRFFRLSMLGWFQQSRFFTLMIFRLQKIYYMIYAHRRHITQLILLGVSWKKKA